MKSKYIKNIAIINKYLKTKILNRPLRQLGRNIIFTYHGVSIFSSANCVRQELFSSQISWIVNNYRVVSLFDFVEKHLSCGNNSENIAAITFDDGYENFAELALPVLKKFSCKSTIFIPSGKTGQYNDWDLGRADFCRLPTMSFSQIKNLPNNLVDIGSHGISHQPLTSLSPDDVEDEIINSKKVLEENTGRAVDFFSFPYGIVPQAYISTGRTALTQYRGACTSRWGRNNLYGNRFSLKRVSISDQDSMDDFHDKVNGYYDWLEFKESVGSRIKKLTRKH